MPCAGFTPPMFAACQLGLAYPWVALQLRAADGTFSLEMKVSNSIVSTYFSQRRWAWAEWADHVSCSMLDIGSISGPVFRVST